MPTDTIDRLRALALEGLAPDVVAAPTTPRKRRRSEPGAPPVPAGAAPCAREELPLVLREGAELEWRRAAQSWTPTLERLDAQGVVAVAVRGRDVTVTMRNGTQRAKGIAAPWVSVVVAFLTGRELPAVRAALKRGVNLFVPESQPGGP